MNYFEKLNNINVNDKTETRNGLTYLSWAWAYGELKKRYPLSFYTVYENAEGLFYHTDGKTCWVKTGVTVVDGEWKLEHIEYLPVMDYRNKSIPVDSVTSFDVNKAIQRSLTKAVARHGLGLYIYAGEDLPEVERAEEAPVKRQTAVTVKTTKPVKEAAKVSVGQTDAEMKRRGDEIKQLFEEFGYTAADYKVVAIELKSVNPREMTGPEFSEHMKKVRQFLVDMKQS
jgi:hypothetical protein